MGLGKTIQALALIVSRPSEDPGNKTNLIIAPVSLMRQWEQEIKSKINERARLRTYIYHGQRVGKVTFAALSSYDIVLTTFGTIAAEFKRKQTWLDKLRQNPAARPDPKGYTLLGDRCKWYRIIVDEAQNIKVTNSLAMPFFLANDCLEQKYKISPSCPSSQVDLSPLHDWHPNDEWDTRAIFPDKISADPTIQFVRAVQSGFRQSAERQRRGV